MFWKRKKKDSNDYLKNELLRSRMSDISLRTDEIIQQYLFVAKEETLTLEEYLKIRGLATTELGQVNPASVVVCCAPQVNAQMPLKDDVNANIQQEHNVVIPIKSSTVVTEGQKEVIERKVELPIREEKRPVKPRPEPATAAEDRDSDFNFLKIMQEMDD